MLDALKAEPFFVHNLFTHRKNTITITSATLAFFKDKPLLKTKHLEVKYVSHDKNMLGIMLSKKAVPGAAQRNNIKRRFKCLFAKNKNRAITYAALLLIRIKIQAEKKDINDILEREWKSLIEQLG